LSQGYWAVITAVIVMQASVGGSLKATVDRLVGTVAGAVYGGVVDFAIPHTNPAELGIALAIALAPLAVLAALYPSFRVAPVTAIIVLLTPSAGSLGPLQFTVDRILEIALGSIVGLAVSLLILPARAHNLVAQAAARIYSLLGELLPMALAGLEKQPDRIAILMIQARIRKALARLEAVAGEARGERAGRLTDDPEPDPLVRTSMRLRHDLVMLIRAAGEPMPPDIYARLQPSLTQLSQTGTLFLKDAAASLAARRPAPALQPFSEALEAYKAELESLRHDGLTRNLPGDIVGRLFAMGFGLEQMRQDLGDLDSRITEFARPEATSTALPPHA
jgi:uncharacterized membrane protein YccC